MSDLRELYNEVITDHRKTPRNFRVIENANRHADGHNPLCGDNVSIYLDVEDGVIKDISFVGSGCAISTASASIMTTVLKGRSIDDAEAAFQKFHDMVTVESDEEIDPDSLGKLAVFSGVREFPARVKCASLAWHTVHAALNAIEEPATTE